MRLDALILSAVTAALLGSLIGSGCQQPSSADDDDAIADDDDSSGCAGLEPAAGQTLGLLRCSEGAEAGYTLFTPNLGEDAFLIDQLGRLVHRWEAEGIGGVVQLREDGLLLRNARTGNSDWSGIPAGYGRLELLDWSGSVAWSYEVSTTEMMLHHDAISLPNGNILASAWDRVDGDDLPALGRTSVPDGGFLATEHLLEIEPDLSTPSGGQVVWEWRALDHLIQDADPDAASFGVVADNPGRLDINFGASMGRQDWNQVTGLAFDPVTDRILVSAKGLHEVWVIDHDTTTEEAAGPAGDLIYRWGNPQTYDAGTGQDRVFESVHDPTWIPEGMQGEGEILVFNNGFSRGWASVDQFEAPDDGAGGFGSPGEGGWGPEALSWTWPSDQTSQLVSAYAGSAQRLSNGNTVISEAVSGRLIEVDDDGDVVWEYISPATASGILQQGEEAAGARFPGSENQVFGSSRLALDHPGLAGQDLTAGDPLVSRE